MKCGYARRISSHLAAALILFCLLQIAIVVRMGGSLILHLGVISATGLFAIAAQALERRWEYAEQTSLPGDDLALRFRRDVAQVWLASIFGALIWVPITIFYHLLFA